MRHRHHTGLVSKAMIAVATLGIVGVLPKSADAASIDVFLIASHKTPLPSTTAPFSIETTRVYQLGGDFTNGGAAKTATLIDNFTFNIDSPLTVNSLDSPDRSKPIDPGESEAGNLGYANSQVASWDNVNIPISGTASDEQIDLGRNASIIFNPVQGGFTDLVLAELGGFNPFWLGLCSDASCTDYAPVFSGLSSSFQRSFIQSGDFPEFAINDSNDDSEMDQTWLFRFSEPVFNYVKVLEFDNRAVFTNNRLQVDFIGAGGSSLTPVPVPTGLPLLASGLGLLVWARCRRRT